MKPKEKALELIQGFYLYTSRINNAIDCAIDCADEVLKAIPMYVGELNPKWKYWNDVKQEILKQKNS